MTRAGTIPTTVYDHAEAYHRLGLAVLPVRRGTKAPPIKWADYQTRMPDASERYEWFEARRFDVALLCGEISAGSAACLVVLDYDGLEGFSSHEAVWPVLGHFPRVRTGRGAHHVLFRVRTATRKYDTTAPDGSRLEVRAHGHITVAPPSLHHSGNPYVWERPPWQGIPIIDRLEDIGLRTEAPQAERTQEPVSDTGEPLSDAVRDELVSLLRGSYVDGQRHTVALAVSGWLAGLRVPEADARAVVDRLIESSGDARDARDRQRAVADSYERARLGKPFAGWARLTDRDDPLVPVETARALDQLMAPRRGTIIGLNGKHPPGSGALRIFARTDTGNAERLVARHGESLRYNHTRGVWHIWDGRRWAEDRDQEVHRLAKETTRAIIDEARAADDDQRKALLKHAIATEAAGRRNAMITLAQAETVISATNEQFNRDVWLLNATNGTVDLRTGELRPHSRDELLTKIVATPYDPTAKCPMTDAFLLEIFQGNQELIAYLWRLFGLSLIGKVLEHILLVCWGAGQNGKSTLLNLVRLVLGDYAVHADMKTFMESKTERIGEDLVALDGARLVTAIETDDGQRFAASLIKSATGGEPIRARRLYENGFSFQPQFTLWLAVNHRPVVRGDDAAMWRRIRLLPFDYRVPDHRRDPRLPDRLLTEAPGILARMVTGCLEYQATGLRDPDIVLASTAAYRADSDPVGEWLRLRCVAVPGHRETMTDLYRDYRGWCESQSIDPVPSHMLGNELTSRGIADHRTKTTRYRIGYRLRTPEENRATAGDDW